MTGLDFEKLLLEAVNESLSSLGESPKQAIYFHLEKNFHVRKHEIPYKIETFASAIEKIFGSGANLIEIMIMKRLYEKVEPTVTLHGYKDFTFIEYVTNVKQSISLMGNSGRALAKASKATTE